MKAEDPVEASKKLSGMVVPQDGKSLSHGSEERYTGELLSPHQIRTGLNRVKLLRLLRFCYCS